MKTITLRQVRHHYGIYVLLLPAVLLVALFSYYPAASAVYHAFFRWNGDDIAEFVGLAHFFRAFLKDETLAYAFGIVLIFIVANFVKMIPSIATAVVVHRMASERSRYLYRVLFVIPMIIPGIVWLLIWKYFYNGGVLNTILRGTGGMWVLDRFDVHLPRVAAGLAPLIRHVVSPVFSGTFGMLLAGIMLLSAQRGLRAAARAWLWWGPLLIVAFLLYGGGLAFETSLPWTVRVPWYFVAVVGVVLGAALVRDRLAARGQGAVAVRLTRSYRWLGLGLTVAAGLLIIFGQMWTEPTGLFSNPDGSPADPAWLGDKTLALPAIVFWGFPWVGVVSVLLYLSGLGNIDTSVYEAADIDGCGWFRKFWNIELPLIMNQVRLNLVLMIIATLKGWGLVFIIWGDSGGPGGAAMLPGLYMFRKAFTDLQAGYACAIGLLLFLLILYLTLINNKYVRVDK